MSTYTAEVGIRESSPSPLYLSAINWDGSSYGVRTVGLGWYFYAVAGNEVKLLTGFGEAKRVGLYTLLLEKVSPSMTSNAESNSLPRLDILTWPTHSSIFVQTMGEWDRNFISVPLPPTLVKQLEEECEAPRISAKPTSSMGHSLISMIGTAWRFLSGSGIS